MIGKRLKTFRKKIGLTQTELGESLGVSMRTVQNWEGEERELHDSTIKHMAIKYRLNESWIKTGEGEMFTESVEQEEFSEEIKELIQLIKDYGNPKIIAEFKDKLLKIKKIIDEMDKS